MLDDINELRTFQRIVAVRSLSAAARDLGLSLGVVSKRLQALERRIGVRLFHRTTRKLSPTNEGLALAPYIDRVLGELAAAEASLADGRDEPHGLVRITAPISLGRVYLAPLLGELAQRYPRLSFELSLTDRVMDLVEERIDVAVRIGAPASSSAVIRRLADNVRILAAAPSYLDHHGRPQHPREFGGHALLRYGDGVGPWRLRGPGAEVFELEAECRLRADSGDAVHVWALAGHGIMLRSLVDLAPDLAAGRLERVAPAWSGGTAPIYALYPSKDQLPPKTRILLDALARRLSDTNGAPSER